MIFINKNIKYIIIRFSQKTNLEQNSPLFSQLVSSSYIKLFFISYLRTEIDPEINSTFPFSDQNIYKKLLNHLKHFVSEETNPFVSSKAAPWNKSIDPFEFFARHPIYTSSSNYPASNYIARTYLFASPIRSAPLSAILPFSVATNIGEKE